VLETGCEQPTKGHLGFVTLQEITDLDALAALLESSDGTEELYVRWSKGPEDDLAGNHCSRDSLTGVELPGLSASPLNVEPWWGDRPLRLWVARRLYDYRHLREQRGPGVRPWVLVGEERGRGPDNEPLVVCRRPIAWVSDGALRECETTIKQLDVNWGPLNRGERSSGE
jgi:hypothetical protein